MANYSKFKLTNRGLELQTKVQAGAVELDFTRFGMGNGSFYFPGDVPALTALGNEKMSRPVQAVRKIALDSCKVTTTILAENLPVQGFDMTEIGLFATDPDLGEILYGVVYAGTTADHIPSKADGSPYEYVINLVVSVGDSLSVTLKVDGAASVTNSDLDYAIAVSRVGMDVNLSYEPTLSEMVERRMFQRNGAQLRVSDFPLLFSKIGRIYTPPEIASEFFYLPDDRGLFSRFLDSGAGRSPDAANRIARPDGVVGDAVGTTEMDQNKNHSHGLLLQGGGNGGGACFNSHQGGDDVSTAYILLQGGTEARSRNMFKWGGIFYDPAL